MASRPRPSRTLSLLAAAVLAVSPDAAATSGREARLAEMQGETGELVEKLVMGTEGEAAVAARLHRLGQEPLAAQLLASYVRVPDERVRRRVAEALATLAVPSSEPVLAAMTLDPDGAVRLSAVRGLRYVHSRRVRELVPLLEDASPRIRREVAVTLGAAQRREAGKLLMRAAQAEAEPETRAAMLISVGQSGDAHQSVTLAGLLRSSSESTRLAAAQGLCLLGAPSGLAVVRKLLVSPDAEERRAAVGMLEGVQARWAAPLLLPRLKDADAATGARAARVLYQAGNSAMATWLMLATARAEGDAKLAYASELELLHLTDEERRALAPRPEGASWGH